MYLDRWLTWPAGHRSRPMPRPREPPNQAHTSSRGARPGSGSSFGTTARAVAAHYVVLPGPLAALRWPTQHEAVRISSVALLALSFLALSFLALSFLALSLRALAFGALATLALAIWALAALTLLRVRVIQFARHVRRVARRRPPVHCGPLP